ncbi:hypothetical protein BDN71DRAFT_1435603 [Pleurotus eryngii]|uniref:Uncharacterized protein n=1 Tax=Pleurotus eryngii TaxID=5323 RepID=A0A9P5ZNU3_PLEER|nr:hypothetical protein BDN71DRAFT_1435603 [Pleurotus eryngii]
MSGTMSQKSVPASSTCQWVNVSKTVGLVRRDEGFDAAGTGTWSSKNKIKFSYCSTVGGGGVADVATHIQRKGFPIAWSVHIVAANPTFLNRDAWDGWNGLMMRSWCRQAHTLGGVQSTLYAINIWLLQLLQWNAVGEANRQQEMRGRTCGHKGGNGGWEAACKCNIGEGEAAAGDVDVNCSGETGQAMGELKPWDAATVDMWIAKEGGQTFY